MHPQIRQHAPGSCSICGMKLIPYSGASQAKLDAHAEIAHGYVPLIVVISMIAIVTVVLTYRDVTLGTYGMTKSLSYVMIGFFLTFSGFKLMDLKGFAEGYATYDIIARKFYFYGYVYPFIELLFGVAMILWPSSTVLLFTELLVMTVSGVGVIQKLRRNETITCVCLGTFLKVPLTNVTLVEDLGMALLAGIMLIGKA